MLARICRVLRPGGRLVLIGLFERAPILTAKQPKVDRFLSTIISPMTQAEAYPPLLRQTGLWSEEIRDISAQTLPVHLRVCWPRAGGPEASSFVVG